jgi:predicted NBD/HSP70 family sugar kinase
VFERLHDESRQGNAAAVALEDEIANYLAQALASVVNLFTPDLVLFGGILSSAPEHFVRTVRERTRGRLFPLLREDFRLERTDSGDSAVVRGGAAVALETLHYA